MSSKYTKYSKKRKQDLDLDTSEAGVAHRERERDRSQSPPKRSRRRDKGSPDGNDGAKEESLSIEETNKLRAKLGLAPLEIEEPSKPSEDEDAAPGAEKLFTEHGIEIVHKAAKSLTAQKEEDKFKEKLEAQKHKRQVQAKLFKGTKGLADSDSEDEGAASWVEKNRKMEEERRKAEERAKALDEMDETFGVGRLVEDRKTTKKSASRRQPSEPIPAGLIVGHSREAFLDGKQTILVLQDKDVLDSTEDEVLINPNMIDDERHKKNVELRKKKTGYRPYEDDVDEFGQTKKQDILAKYAEDEDSQKRETFRLDNSGSYDVDKEAHEMDMKRKLMMANKKFESLEQPRYQIAREFYTEEEMIAFRKPKKKKDSNKIRKRKVLKADDLVPQEESETKEERDARLAKLAQRRQQEGGAETLVRPTNGHAPASLREATESGGVSKLEEGELDEDTGPTITKEDKTWKKTVDASVDVDKLKSLMSKVVKDDSDSDESSDGDLIGGANLAGVVVEDDEEEKEMRNALERSRRLRQLESAPNGSASSSGAEKVREMLTKHRAIKEEDDMEEDDDDDTNLPGGNKGIVIDATSEYYKSIGDIPTYGLAGNRDDDVDYSELHEEHKKIMEHTSRSRVKEERRYSDDEIEAENSPPRRRRDSDADHMDVVERTPSPGPSKRTDGRLRSKSSRRDSERSDASDDVYGEDYKNVLGEEKDVTKGVAAMLKLAGEKGYLQPGNSKNAGEGALKHLESKRYSKVEQGRYDIEDKYMKKLERMGTTGTGPTRSFVEKRDYVPNVEITYTDGKGRLLDEKEAFRQLSWKFHGKGPGKKQIEKRQAKLDKKERLKKMNSMDTPLGTLQKQLKKQEQTQSAYLVLSGMGKDGAPLQKD